MKNNGISFIVGFLFAIGLGISGMTKPSVVKGFLDVFGNWNPALLFVMVGAVIVHSIFYQAIKKQAKPFFDLKFHLPTRKDVDLKLLAGAALFGIGWGLAGFCPGPAIVTASSGVAAAVIFVAAMIIGMYSYRLFATKFLNERN